MRNIATTRILCAPEITGALGSPSPWVWPLPGLNGIPPCIVGPADGSAHDSVDIGYPDRCWSPRPVPVLAACDGVITFVGSSQGSLTVCVDHAGGWSTQYADLGDVLGMPTDRFRRRRKTRVRAGDVLGHARGSAPYIHFGLSRFGDTGWCIVDPTALMHTWSVLPWFIEPAIDRAA
jgi:murein DD-endopeptidase MepM/ murein hydrolase activator NlpD